MNLSGPGQPLVMANLPIPEPGEHDIRIKVLACGVCRTDLHIVDGELPLKHPGIVPGHEVVGRVVAAGRLATRFQMGDGVGIPWLGGTCGHCTYCTGCRENLCDTPVFTGYDRNGGFAEYSVADERFCFFLPDRYDDMHATPLLCAGLIGYRAYRLSGVFGSMRLGLYGFGAAAHIICQIAVAQGQQVYAFVRPGDQRSQRFALQLGACWAGTSDTLPSTCWIFLIWQLTPLPLPLNRVAAMRDRRVLSTRGPCSGSDRSQHSVLAPCQRQCLSRASVHPA